MQQYTLEKMHGSTVAGLEAVIERYEGEVGELEYNMEMLRKLFSDFRSGSEQDRERLLNSHRAVVFRLAKGAVRQLQQILARMSKGELGLRVVVWRTAMQQYNLERLYGSTASLEEELEASEQNCDLQYEEAGRLYEEVGMLQGSVQELEGNLYGFQHQAETLNRELQAAQKSSEAYQKEAARWEQSVQTLKGELKAVTRRREEEEERVAGL